MTKVPRAMIVLKLQRKANFLEFYETIEQFALSRGWLEDKRLSILSSGSTIIYVQLHQKGAEGAVNAPIDTVIDMLRRLPYVDDAASIAPSEWPESSGPEA